MAQTKQRKQFNLPEDLDDDESQIQVKHLYVFPKKCKNMLFKKNQTFFIVTVFFEMHEKEP